MQPVRKANASVNNTHEERAHARHIKLNHLFLNTRTQAELIYMNEAAIKPHKAWRHEPDLAYRLPRLLPRMRTKPFRFLVYKW